MTKDEALAMFGSMPDFPIPEGQVDHDWHDRRRCSDRLHVPTR
jgi:hypothetical protein